MSKFNNRRSQALWTVLLVLSLSLIVVILAGSAAAEDDVVATLSLDPAGTLVLGVGQDIDIDIRTDNIAHVYGAQIAMSFDETILQATGGQLTPGVCPQPDFVQANSANNTTGDINYAVSQLSPTAPCAGGVMATVNFECVAVGESNVTFTSSIIADLDGNAIAHTATGGSIKCEQAVVEFNGSVALQAWPDPTGVEVSLFDTFGHVDGPVVVGPDGVFRLVANDETETYRVVAKYPRYLSVEAAGLTGVSGDVINLGLATLRAGDINGDGVINILDLTALAGNFNKTSPQAWAP